MNTRNVLSCKCFAAYVFEIPCYNFWLLYAICIKKIINLIPLIYYYHNRIDSFFKRIFKFVHNTNIIHVQKSKFQWASF